MISMHLQTYSVCTCKVQLRGQMQLCNGFIDQSTPLYHLNFKIPWKDIAGVWYLQRLWGNSYTQQDGWGKRTLSQLKGMTGTAAASKKGPGRKGRKLRKEIRKCWHSARVWKVYFCTCNSQRIHRSKNTYSSICTCLLIHKHNNTNSSTPIQTGEPHSHLSLFTQYSFMLSSSMPLTTKPSPQWCRREPVLAECPSPRL